MHLPPQQHVKQSLLCLTVSVHLLLSRQIARTISQVHLVTAMIAGIELTLTLSYFFMSEYFIIIFCKV